MPWVRLNGETFELEGEETVLECLERNQVAPPSSCRRGHCQVCVMTCKEGTLPVKAQPGLSAPARALGRFLPCVCRPHENLTLAAAKPSIYPSRLLARSMLNQDIARLVLTRPPGFEVFPGQFIHVHKNEQTVRSYSVANRAHKQDHIELHVKKMPRGAVSPWLVDELRPQEEFQISGPFGDCVYTQDCRDKILLLAGISTGLAPLVGILEQALASGHRGPIELYRGATRPQGLYLTKELQELSAQHVQLSVFSSVLIDDGTAADLTQTPIERLILSRHPNTKDLRAYLCGAADFVQGLKKSLFLAGTPFQEIFSDAFSTHQRDTQKNPASASKFVA